MKEDENTTEEYVDLGLPSGTLWEKENEKGYVDLGLPSGTLWKSENEDGYYTFYKAVNEFGKTLPTKEQFEELKNECKWKWNRKGYTVKGPNGKIIFLPANGYRGTNGIDYFVDTDGFYWSYTDDEPNYPCHISSHSVGVLSENAITRRDSFSVRLVK